MEETLFPIGKGSRDQSRAADAASPSSSSASGKYSRARHEYGDLVGFFVDEARAQNDGAEPPRTMKSRVGKEIAVAIKEGQHPDLIRETIRRIVRRGISPAKFQDVLWQVQCDLKGSTVEESSMLTAYIAHIKVTHGLYWPTGSRWVRGTAAGTFVPDPLGCDKPTYPVEWTSPSRQSVIAALKEKHDASND